MDISINARQKFISEDGTEKFLFELADGKLIESVLMKQGFGTSICVSTQAGCSMGCKFCASGLCRKERNLFSEEMLLQVLEAKKESASPVTHVVLMGTGEPFDNYDESVRFCDIISSEKLLAGAMAKLKAGYAQNLFAPVAPRHITVSTCGLVPGILNFIRTNNRYNLAISLHAPNDELRNRLMPVNRKYPLKELVAAVSEYTVSTRRRATFEYILLDGINDNDECAEELASLLKGLDAYVNLIPFNPVKEFPFHGTGKAKALHFYDILMQNNIRATLRKERGSDIAAACGQLRASCTSM